METERILTEDVPAIALEWVGTPYVYGAKVKGKGVDCARFIIAVFQEAGLIPRGYKPPHQHKDWLYGKNVKADVFVREIVKYGRKIEYQNRRPGDVVSFLYNGIESHLGIIVDDDCIVHAVDKQQVKKVRLRSYSNLCSVYRFGEA